MRANLYVNGLAAPAVSASGAITDFLPAHNDFRIGAREYCTAPCTGALFFGGRIDEVRVWNVARSQAAIQESMFKQISGGTAGLKGYWTLNEAVPAMVANDSTMSRSTGVLMGGTAHEAGVRSPLIDEPYTYYTWVRRTARPITSMRRVSGMTFRALGASRSSARAHDWAVRRARAGVREPGRTVPVRVGRGISGASRGILGSHPIDP